jgi:hypothetical protein
MMVVDLCCKKNERRTKEKVVEEQIHTNKTTQSTIINSLSENLELFISSSD